MAYLQKKKKMGVASATPPRESRPATPSSEDRIARGHPVSDSALAGPLLRLAEHITPPWGYVNAVGAARPHKVGVVL
jgi:hypothetical protein